jgi:ABC-2 type transport system permease protein
LDQYLQEIESLRRSRELNNLEVHLADFQSVSPDVLVAPFNSQTASLQGFSLTPTNFFAPAVVVLLLQHLAVTFSALSIVRERRSGTMELFRISPLSPIEILIGKYWATLLYGRNGCCHHGHGCFPQSPDVRNLVELRHRILALLFASLGWAS